MSFKTVLSSFNAFYSIVTNLIFTGRKKPKLFKRKDPTVVESMIRVSRIVLK